MRLATINYLINNWLNKKALEGGDFLTLNEVPKVKSCFRDLWGAVLKVFSGILKIASIKRVAPLCI